MSQVVIISSRVTYYTELRGIDKQSAVGFLALLEHLRYCEVGSFLKNPINPVWVLGSETHLTVLFSFEKQLVSAETPTEVRGIKTLSIALIEFNQVLKFTM
jgi:hypothetical protein